MFTNASAQLALQTLSAASKALSATQNKISTGYRIDIAEDNAAYWSIATTQNSNAAVALSAAGHSEFVKNLVDSNNRDIGQLVDADLNEESAKLKALQTQEQLAIQALSIAHNRSEDALQLLQE